MSKKVARSMSLLLALVCLTTALCMSTSAVEITPRYTGITTLNADINVSSSGRADCYGYVRTRSGYSADVTVELQCDGQTIKSWSDSGSGVIEIEKTYYVTPGHDYQVVVTAVVRNAQGVIVEIPSSDSLTVPY